ncbi:MAG: hypothetical protein U1E76_17190 [Planctomycetota bacterium]
MDKFGVDVDSLGDQDGDGLSELSVGAIWFNAASHNPYSDDFGPGRVFDRKGATSTFSYHRRSASRGVPDVFWYGWGAALAVGKIDANAKLDLAIGNARTTDPRRRPRRRAR